MGWQFSDEFKREALRRLMSGLSRRQGFKAARRQPAFALCMEEDVLEAVRAWQRPGGGDPSAEEGAGTRHRGARHLKKATAYFARVEA